MKHEPRDYLDEVLENSFTFSLSTKILFFTPLVFIKGQNDNIMAL